MPTVPTEELIMADLEMLRHGGKEAIALFMEMSRRLHEESAIDGMQDWVTIAAPALPEKERNEVIVMLMGSHLSRQSQARMGSKTSAPTRH